MTPIAKPMEPSRKSTIGRHGAIAFFAAAGIWRCYRAGQLNTIRRLRRAWRIDGVVGSFPTLQAATDSIGD